MDVLKIESGARRVAVNGDPERVIEFNPDELAFAERFYQLIHEFEGKLAEYQERAGALDEDGELDANGLPANLGKRLALLREACEYLREQIDTLFGAGTSQKAFGEAMSLDLFEQFFTGITPFVQQARSAKLEKYSPPAGRRAGRRVMK